MLVGTLARANVANWQLASPGRLMEMREAHTDDGSAALGRAEIELIACRDALRRLSEQLDRQRDHLESVLSVIADAAIVVDKQGLIGFVNPAAKALLGWDFAEAVGKPLSSLVSYVQDVSPMPGATAFDAVRAAVSGGAATINVVFRDHLGRDVVLQCRLTSLLDESDQFTGAVLTLNDGSRRHFESLMSRAGQDSITHADALFEEKERAQVTLNSIGDAVISTDFRGRVSYLNIVA